tara:strand:+ start:615 stop:1616 length:1002 start_codon:yes stop_codon:yes gene_type:complete
MSIKIIAEAAQGFEGKYDQAMLLLKAGAGAKANAIKFQMVFADELCTKEYTYSKLFKSLEMTNTQWRSLLQASIKLGIELQLDIFGKKSLSLCSKLGIKTVKLHPTDITNTHLLKLVKSSKIDNIILGVGGATLKEINLALEILKKKNVIIIFGFQNYPTPTHTNQINRLTQIKEKLIDKNKNLTLGFADHEETDSVIRYMIPALAIGAGATIIEKHITLGKSMEMEDSESALNPDEFKLFVKLVNDSSKAIAGFKDQDDFGMSKEELNYRNTIRRHVLASKNLSKGKIIEEKDIVLKRSSELKPIKDINFVVGKTLKKNIKKDHPFKKTDLL